MAPPVIAVDMDDVLANTNETLYRWHNKTYLTDLKLQADAKYFHQWLNRGWGNGETTRRKLQAFEESPEWDMIPCTDEATDALKYFKELGYILVVVTARRPEKAQSSRRFLLKHFPSIFNAIYFCKDTESDEVRKALPEPTQQELFGEKGQDDESVQIFWHPGAKSEVCKDINAKFLIDDSIENAFEVIEHGPTTIEVALFGPYLWNHRWTDMKKHEFKDLDYAQSMKRGFVDDTSYMDLPDQVARCVNWPEVQSYIAKEATQMNRKR